MLGTQWSLTYIIDSLAARLGLAPGWREAHHGCFCVRGDILSFFAKTNPIEGDFVDAAMFMRFEYNWGCQDKSRKPRRKCMVRFG